MPFHYREIKPGGAVPTNPQKTCGSGTDRCTACCSTVPVSEIGLSPYTRCHYLRAPFDPNKGCSIYPDRPISCRNWSCVWLSSELPDELRPDRCGIVIDPIPDLVRVGGEEIAIVQIWVMRGHEEAYDEQPIVREAIMLLLERGNPILWRLPYGPGEKPMARVLFSVDGQLAVSPPHESVKNLSGFSNDAQRLARAQRVLQGTK